MVTDAAALVEIESIKQLKARYCRLLDTKDWDGWRQIFTDDFLSDTSEAGGKVIHGADAFVAYVRNTLGKPARPTVHQVHAPEIELTSATTARGVWALNDVVRLAPALNLNAYGHYHETYEKVDGQWCIKTSKLTRLRQDVFNPVFSLRISDRMKNAAAKLARRQPARRSSREGRVEYRFGASARSDCADVRGDEQLDGPQHGHQAVRPKVGARR